MALEFLAPLPESLIDEKKEAAKISLGKKLFHEKKLSKSGTISCSSCHGLDNFGVDSEPTSPGHEGKRGERNSPTVFNTALNFTYFWDGRAETLWQQALGPITNPLEHGHADEKEALSSVEKTIYAALFEKAFPKEKAPFNFNNIGHAIAAFERTLLTPSAFDKFLKGKDSAISTTAKEGLQMFMDKGCVGCHEGPGVGGTMFQKLGLVKDYPTTDMGRFTVTKEEDDRKVFKVPILRNIVHTGPYLHDGSIASLEKMISIMGEYQLGIKLTASEIAHIQAFLRTL